MQPQITVGLWKRLAKHTRAHEICLPWGALPLRHFTVCVSFARPRVFLLLAYPEKKESTRRLVLRLKLRTIYTYTYHVRACYEQEIGSISSILKVVKISKALGYKIGNWSYFKKRHSVSLYKRQWNKRVYPTAKKNNISTIGKNQLKISICTR